MGDLGSDSSSGLLVSRSRFLAGGAAFLGAVAFDALHGGLPAVAAGGADPRPVPGGFVFDDQGNFTFVTHDPVGHTFFPVVGLDMSTITDFRGVVAGAEVQGHAEGSDGSQFWFDADMRFMSGEYIGVDGKRRDRTFEFV